VINRGKVPYGIFPHLSENAFSIKDRDQMRAVPRFDLLTCMFQMVFDSSWREIKAFADLLAGQSLRAHSCDFDFAWC
jgi:hypothetical protein